MELKDWLNSINQTKKHLIDEDPSLEKEYPPYIINRCFSGHLDTLMFTNEMNDKIKDLDYVKRYYGYSNEKAKQALKILTKEQLNFIKSKFDTGGKG
jgi:hypothetical protein